MSEAAPLPLAGVTIAMAESRELDLFADMVAQRGGTAWRCPLVSIRDTPDEAGVRAWLEALIAGEMDEVILFTGEGVRRLMNVADRAGRRDEVVAALGRTVTIVRGPKPVKALRELGLRPTVNAETPTTAGVIEVLRDRPLTGRTVGVQLYGDRLNAELTGFLERAGAAVRPVWPYVYASDADDQRVVALIDALAAGEVDVLALTSSPQVRRLFDVAEGGEREAALRRGLARTMVAVIGPVAAEPLRERGVAIDVMPEGRYTLKPLLTAIAAAVARS